MGDPPQPAPRMPMPDDGSAYAKLYLQRLKGQDPPGSSQATDESRSVVTDKDDDAVSVQTRNDDAVSVQTKEDDVVSIKSKEDDIISIKSKEDSLFGDEDEPLNTAQDQEMAVQQPEEVINLEELHVSATAADKHPEQPNKFSEGTLFCGRPLRSTIVVPKYQQPQPPLPEDDEDDDLMIIEASEVADHVKALFASRSKPFDSDTSEVEIIDVKVKQEPRSPILVLEEVPEHPADVFGDMLPEPAAETLPHPEVPEPDIEEPDIKAEEASAPVAVVVVNDDDDDEEMFVDEHLDVQPAADSTPGSSHDNGNPGQEQGHDQNAGNDDNHTDDDNDADPQYVIQNNGDGDDDDEFMIDEDQELSDGEQARARRRKSKGKQKEKHPATEAGKEANEELSELSKEDIQEELEVLRNELKLYEKRKVKGKIVPRDVERIEETSRRYALLRAKLATFGDNDNNGASVSQPAAAAIADEGLRQLMEMEDLTDTENGTVAESSKQRTSAKSIPAVSKRLGTTQQPTSGLQKRKFNPFPGSSRSNAKKQKQNGKNGRKGRPEFSSTTEMILDMIGAENAIASSAQMDDMPAFDDITAKTVKEQMQKIKDQLNPGEDAKRVRNDLKRLEWARKIFGFKNCKPNNGRWVIKGVAKHLHHYQLVGAGWMLHREIHSDGPFGGILADQVGLGKTIEAIACMAGNPLSEEDRAGGRLGTLIVVPPTLVTQWRTEIHECSPQLTVTYFRTNKQNPVWMPDIEKADVVITTYLELCKGYPNTEKLKLLDKMDEPEQTTELNKELGVLFSIQWHRVFLDEAHCIKNINTQTARACLALQAKNRWAITATPVHNGAHEVYPYMQFLRVHEDLEFKQFKKDVTGKGNGDEYVHEFLDEVLLHRKLETLFLGKVLFKIPKGHPLPLVWVKLSDEETVVYRHIDKACRKRINRYLQMHRSNSEKKPPRASFLTIAMRLRQAATHPFLLFSVIRDMFELQDIKAIRQKLAVIQQRHPDRPFIEQIGRFWATIEGKMLGAQAPAEGQGSFGKGSHGLAFNMDPQLEHMEKIKKLEAAICALCSEPLMVPRRVPCGHIFCRDCLDFLVETQREKDASIVSCPTCDAEHSLDQMMGTSLYASDPGSRNGSQARRRPGDKRSRHFHSQPLGNDYMGFQPMGENDTSAFLQECDKNVNLDMAPSAKTTWVKDIILDWQKRFPDDKIIVFTQWVMAGRILGRMLEQEKIQFLYFFGEMLRDEKDKAVKAFHDVKEVKVLVASLKCGGQGLNLTCANRVILIDPWWNSAMEQQGYGRVFRMGQTKETYFVRLLAKNTIDGRLAELQAKKLKKIKEMVKDYDTTRSAPKFEEVAELFGKVKYDDQGEVLEVQSDYDSDDDDDAFDEPDLEAINLGPSGAAQEMGIGGLDAVARFNAGSAPIADNGYGIQDEIL